MSSEADLMAFNSPPKIEIIIEKAPDSPGSNPFDAMQKLASDGSEISTVKETNILDMAFIEGTTFMFTQTLSTDQRESLTIDDCGKESLGILHINFEELNNENTLYLQPPTKISYHSFIKSISSKSSQSSQPSTIYSLQASFRNDPTPDMFNIAMSPTLIERHLKSANTLVVSPRRSHSVSCLSRQRFDGFRGRISSGPSAIKDDPEKWASDNLLYLQDDQQGQPLKTDDDSLDDLVFIEANYVATKIADGSILEEPQENILDSTPQPQFEEIVVPEENKKCDTETVFKMLDKMLPASNETTDSKNSSGGSVNTAHSAKEAIQNLAEILKSEHINESRKAEGQNLLMSLAGILCNENNSSLNDSGHSSIELEQDVQEKAECYEVLDLRKKSSGSECEQIEALDLSMNAKKLCDTPKSAPPFSGKRASISMKESPNCTPNQSGMVRRASESSLPSSSREITRNLSILSNQTGSSNASGSSLLSGPITGKLKLKKPSITKIGPVKAVVGLTKKIPTPPVTTDTGGKFKKTSTPINKSKIKPIAQSTPEENKPIKQELPKKKFEFPMSPLSKRNTISHNKSGSDPNISSSSSTAQKLTRSNSVSGVRNKPTSLLGMRRSISTGKGVTLSTTNKAKETDKLNTSLKSGIRKSLGENVLNRSLGGKPQNLLSKLKKVVGKENSSN